MAPLGRTRMDEGHQTQGGQHSPKARAVGRAGTTSSGGPVVTLLCATPKGPAPVQAQASPAFSISASPMPHSGERWSILCSITEGTPSHRCPPPMCCKGGRVWGMHHVALCKVRGPPRITLHSAPRRCWEGCTGMPTCAEQRQLAGKQEP